MENTVFNYVKPRTSVKEKVMMEDVSVMEMHNIVLAQVEFLRKKNRFSHYIYDET